MYHYDLTAKVEGKARRGNEATMKRLSGKLGVEGKEEMNKNTLDWHWTWKVTDGEPLMD